MESIPSNEDLGIPSFISSKYSVNEWNQEQSTVSKVLKNSKWAILGLFGGKKGTTPRQHAQVVEEFGTNHHRSLGVNMGHASNCANHKNNRKRSRMSSTVDSRTTQLNCSESTLTMNNTPNGMSSDKAGSALRTGVSGLSSGLSSGFSTGSNIANQITDTVKLSSNAIRRPINTIVDSRATIQPLLNKSLADLSRDYAQQLARYHRDIVNPRRNMKNRLQDDSAMKQERFSDSQSTSSKSSVSSHDSKQLSRKKLEEDMLALNEHIKLRRAQKMKKLTTILVHIVPSYYILLSRSPWHLLLYNFSIWSVRWFSKTKHPYLQREWLRIWLCLFTALARICFLWNSFIKWRSYQQERRANFTIVNSKETSLEEQNEIHEESDPNWQNRLENPNCKNFQDNQKSHMQSENILSTFVKSIKFGSVMIIQTIALIVTFSDVLQLLKIRSNLTLSNSLFPSVYKNSRLFLPWREERVLLFRDMQSVGRNTSVLICLDLLSIILITSVSVLKELKIKCVKIVQAMHLNPEESLRKNLKEKIKQVAKVGSLLGYIAKPIHIVLFDFLYYNCDHILFLHIASFIANCFLFKICRRLELQPSRTS